MLCYLAQPVAQVTRSTMDCRNLAVCHRAPVPGADGVHIIFIIRKIIFAIDGVFYFSMSPDNVVITFGKPFVIFSLLRGANNLFFITYQSFEV